MKAPAHVFIFQSGIWVGEGKITIGLSSGFMKFYTKWEIEKEDSRLITAIQRVELDRGASHLINRFSFACTENQHFFVSLQNESVGNAEGKGLWDEKKLAWEFRDPHVFEGFEVYELQDNGDYFFHAEYGTPDAFKTTVEGLIWKREKG